MCNAWNHSDGCPCGFGGPTRFGARSDLNIPAVVRYESYVNPFAKCPACGAPVFFFQDRNGGRVFFDELGPPWPKHPCTDRRLREAPIEVFRGRLAAPGLFSPTWQREGWFPFMMTSAIFPPTTRWWLIDGRVIRPDGEHWVSLMVDKPSDDAVNRWVGSWTPTDPTFYRDANEIREVSGVTLTSTRATEHAFRCF